MVTKMSNTNTLERRERVRAVVKQFEQALKDDKENLSNASCPYNEFDVLERVLVIALAEQDKEAFTRGRHWELAEFNRCISTHKPMIPGVCSWCKAMASHEDRWLNLVMAGVFESLIEQNAPDSISGFAVMEKIEEMLARYGTTPP